MTYEKMVAMLEALGQDVYYDYYEKNHKFDVTLYDFEGFDDDWDEIYRDYDDPEAVEHFLDVLEEESLSCEGDYYETYYFDGFSVQIGYSSFDI
jgi:hypothetical protein